MKPAALYLLATYLTVESAAIAAPKVVNPWKPQPRRMLAGAAVKTTGLPLRTVVLFSSGVGYFGRVGRIRDCATIPLAFPTAGINDVLKSLVLYDPSGGVRNVTYGSQDSAAQRLQSLGIPLDGTLSLGTILRRFQGAEVAVRTTNTTYRGRILSVSTVTAPAPVTVDDVQRPVIQSVIQKEVLNLSTANGLRALPLDTVSSVKLLDPALDQKLNESLKLLAANFDETKRTVHLNFAGQGVRYVKAGYLQEAPVWKTSYRLVLDSKAKPYLQGWAVVENTSDEDWKDISLSLVSGRPISFIQDLYQPLYVSRSVVAPQVIGSPNSQVYSETLEENESAAASAPPQLAARNAGRGGAPAGGGSINGAVDGQIFDRVATLENRAASPERLRREDIATSAAQAASVNGQAAGGVRGELFEYAIRNTVNIPKRSAALVPIVSKQIEGQKLSIFDANSSAQYALNGFRLRNTSGMQLAGGPITVYQNGIYAGDAQINTTGRGEDRLVSYAVDLDLVVGREQPRYDRQIIKIVARSGVLFITRQEKRDMTYTFRNKSNVAKTVLVQQNIEPEYTLLSPEKPDEKTAEEYRFKVAAPAKKTVSLKVTSRRLLDEAVALVNSDINLLLQYASNDHISPALKEAIQTLVAKRQAITDLDTKINQLQQHINDINADQNRIRQNMDRLSADSALRQRYTQRLTDQETQIQKLYEELALARDAQADAQKELAAFVNGLTLE